MPANKAADAMPRMIIGLNVVLAAVEEDTPKILCLHARQPKLIALPYGPFDPVAHRTLELGARDWVARQTRLDLGYVEQLYTFGDRGRGAPFADFDDVEPSDRVISVGYLGLLREPATLAEDGAGWFDWYRFFPWEDWRKGQPKTLAASLIPELLRWADDARTRTAQSERAARVNQAFGLDTQAWEEERVLERYELMYEAGLVAEARLDSERQSLPPPNWSAETIAATGEPMASDHRRILATAMGRLRGKLKYRPIIFELTPETFTLLEVQTRVEAIIGFSLHKQNFRRSLETAALVEKTGATSLSGAGRPAALFRAATKEPGAASARGLTFPRQRISL